MISSLAQIRAAFKAKTVGVVTDIRIPAPNKEMAKAEGAKWNSERSTYYFQSENPESHPLYEFRKESDLWAKITKRIDYDFKDVFKAEGVVGEKDGSSFVNWVLLNGKYTELVETLIELEYL